MLRWQTVLIISLFVSVPTLAQDPGDPQEATRVIYDFEMLMDPGPYYVGVREPAVVVPITFNDLSRDDTTGFDPTLPGAGQQAHSVNFIVTPVGNSQGWQALPIVGFPSFAGESRETELQVRANPSVADQNFIVNVTAEIRTQVGVFYRTTFVQFITQGVPGFNAILTGDFDRMKGDEVRTGSLRISNAALVPRLFTIEQTTNPCNLEIVAPANVVVLPKQTVTVTVTVRASDEYFFSYSRDCTAGMEVSPEDVESSRPVTLSITMNGFYVHPNWAIQWSLAAIAMILILVVIAARKRRIDEEILGKPQKPWLIPVEKLYLAKLREKDERAWYVVRHHLMEEEYQSAMLWYKDYKKGTKGSRKKERIILRHEHAFERWHARVETRLAKPAKKAEKFRLKLQRKLDRQARRETIKVRSRADKNNKQLQAAYDKKLARATEKWEKAAAKAEKKGKDVPPQPVLDAPELEPRPEAVVKNLADHKWSAKAERFDLKMDKKHLKLQQKLHKEERKQVAKLRRKVERIGRKLDDPDFMAEHGLEA